MTKIPNETEQKAAYEKLAEKLNGFVAKAKAAINEHQPLRVSPKIGQAAVVVGSGLALSIQRVVDVKKGAGFFLKSILKSYKDTRAAYSEVDKMYELMKRNIKTELPPTKQELEEMAKLVKSAIKPEPEVVEQPKAEVPVAVNPVPVEELKRKVEEHKVQ